MKDVVNELEFLEKKENESQIFYVVNKKQLLNPVFKDQILSLNKCPVVTCYDSELYFNGIEYYNLLKLYKTIKQINEEGSLLFKEKIHEGVHISSEERKASFIIKNLEGISFEAVVQANQSLIDFAKKVSRGYKNKDGKIVELSPYEKYRVCFKFINSFPYFSEGSAKFEGTRESQSFIKTAENQTGCCVGKAQCLKALLNMLGINASCISVNTKQAQYRSGNKSRKSKKIIKYGLGSATNHCVNIIALDDEKYNIHGFIGSDPTNYKLPQPNKSLDWILNALSLSTFQEEEIRSFLDKYINLEELLGSEQGKKRVQELKDFYWKEMRKIYLDYLLGKPQTLAEKKLFKTLKKVDFNGLDNLMENFEDYQTKDNDKISEKIKDLLEHYKGLLVVLAKNQVAIEFLKEAKEHDINFDESIEEIVSLAYEQFTQDDKEVILEAVKQDGMALKKANHVLRNDLEIVLAAIKQNGAALKYASEKLRNDEEIVLEALRQDAMALKYASWELRDDKKIVLEALKKDGYALFYASKRLRDNKKVVLAAVKQNAWALDYASKRLRNDKEIGLEAIRQNGRVLEIVSEELRNDKKVVLEVVRQNAKGLKYASKKLKNDKEVVIEAIKQNASTLEYASEELRNDEEIVLEALKQNPRALQYASWELRGNKKIVLEALKQDGYALEYASEELRNDREVVLAAVKQNGYILQYASEELRNDKEVVLTALNQQGCALQHAGEKLRHDKEIVLRAVKNNGYALQFVPKELRCDREVVLEAIKQNSHALEYASEELKNDNTILLEAITIKSLGLYQDFSEENKIIYDYMAAKDFTDIFKKMSKEQEYYMKKVYKEKYESLKKVNPKEYNEEDVKDLVIYSKLIAHNTNKISKNNEKTYNKKY